MFHIYQIKNKVNNKSYIGITRNLQQRWGNHRSKTKIETEKKPLPMAMKKYGLENFEFLVLESTDCIETAKLKEIEYIKEYKSLWTENGYNISPGGALPTNDQIEVLRERMTTKNPMSILRFNRGSFKVGHKPVFTDERRKNHAIAKIAEKNPMFGNSAAADHLNVKNYECSHCGTKTNKGNYKRWHGDMCKLRCV